MSKRNGYILLLWSLIVMLGSCKPGERATRKDLDSKSSDFLLEVLEANEFKYSWLSSKASFTYTDPEGKKKSFKSSVRIRKDSAIWISITPVFGIEVSRVLITRDTVKMINRMDSKYFVGDINYLNNKLNVTFDYETLQSLLTGNSISFEEDESEIKTATDKRKGYYFISTVKKRKLEKALRKDKFDREVQSLWLDPDTYKVTEMLLNDFKTDRSLKAKYSEHKDIDGQLFPFDISFVLNVTKEKSAKIRVEYSRVYSNKPVKLLFSIPDKYEKIDY